MNSESVLVIGLDGATNKIVDPLLQAGKLPTLQALIQAGHKAVLQSTLPPQTGSAWASFQTGTNPGQHGIFQFVKPNGELITSQDIRLPKIWQMIEKRGHRSCIINLPVTYPVQPLNGQMISSFLTPPGKAYAYPLKLQTRLEKLEYQIDLDDPFAFGKDHNREYYFELIKTLVNQRAKAMYQLFTHQNWQFRFCLFKATDLVQHLDYDGEMTTQVYQQIDTALEKLLKKLKTAYPKQTLHTIIMSDHGFHPTPLLDIALCPLIRSITIEQEQTHTQSLKQSNTKTIQQFNHSILLKILRFLRKHNLYTPKQAPITPFGMYEPDTKKQQLIVKTLSKLKLKDITLDPRSRPLADSRMTNNNKIFQTVTTANKLYGPNYHPDIPDILWLTNEQFAPNADPLSGQLLYQHQSPLKGKHDSDRNGICIVNSPRISKSPDIVPIESLAKLICDLLKTPAPRHIANHDFVLQ
jgi:hypothetical protein